MRLGPAARHVGYSTPPGVGKLCVDALGSGLGSAYAMAARGSAGSGGVASSDGSKSSWSRAGHQLCPHEDQDVGGHDIVNLLQSVEDMFEKTCSAWADCRVESERLQEAIEGRLAASAAKGGEAEEEEATATAAAAAAADAGVSMSGEPKSLLRSHHLERLTGVRGRSRFGIGSPSSVVSDTGSVRVVDEQILV